MRITRLGWIPFVLAGCASVPPPVAAPPPAPPAIVAPAAAPAAAPALALAPRGTWRRIRLPRGTRLAEAWVASPAVENADGTRRVWIVVNLLEPIPLPETGGRARSAAYVADFRCQPHAWNPLLSLWFAQRDARGESLLEPSRGPAGIREVPDGSFVDIFVDAACATRPVRRRR